MVIYRLVRVMLAAAIVVAAAAGGVAPALHSPTARVAVADPERCC